jgi:glycosyltransferase involved in cell wall biosynthesis
MIYYPNLTVLMSAYNEENFIQEAINSMLSQTFTDFEFLIINDGSTDETPNILKSIQDPRITIINNAHNLGLSKSLKIGINQAKGKYIARMDADDISLPQRLEKQVEFLENNLDIGILGTYQIIFDHNNDFINIPQAPFLDIEIRWFGLFGCSFAHPTVMIRKEILDQNKLNYDPCFNYAEDYDLWTRLLKFTRGANLSEPLLRYRLREGISHNRKKEQHTLHREICYRTISSLFPELNFSFDDVCQIGAKFFNKEIFGISPIKTNEKMFRVIKNYFYLLDSFLKTQPDSSYKQALKKKLAINIAREMIKLDQTHQWIFLCKQILAWCPSLPLWLGVTKAQKIFKCGLKIWNY